MSKVKNKSLRLKTKVDRDKIILIEKYFGDNKQDDISICKCT